MNVIFPVAPVVVQIEQNVPRAKVVGIAADLDTALKTPPNVAAAAYVLQNTQAKEPQYSTGDDAYAQDAATTIQVVLWLRNYAQARTGAAARADMDAFTNEVATALIGFAPDSVAPDGFRALWFRGAKDEFYDAAWLVSQMAFQSEFIIGR